MKKFVKMIITIALFSLINVSMVMAADSTATAELVLDKETLKSGDVFTVTLRANCSAGLSFISTKLNYDDSKLTLQNKWINNNWVDYGLNKIELLSNSNEKFTSLDACKWTFKVNENVQGETLEISTDNIDITDINNIQYKLDKLVKTLNIEETTPIIPTETDEPVTPTETEDEKEPQTIVNENNAKKENTTSTIKVLPKTGTNYIVIFLATIGTIVIAIVFFKKYRDMKDI